MALATTSLRHRGHPLTLPSRQTDLLSAQGAIPRFTDKLAGCGVDRLVARQIEILQLNLGKRCNMACVHCHVDAGPDRREMMSRSTVDICLSVLRKNLPIRTLDLTGGAPEMNPHFRELVMEARRLDRHVIDRCNLTILLAAGYDDLPEFLAEHHVEIVASLPCYLETNTDAQRGHGAFAESIAALRQLNDLGYGQDDTDLKLTLVYNPVGTGLPPHQGQLEASYRRELAARHGVRFSRLVTMTNMPISRYLDHLVSTGQLEPYLQTLANAFNPATVEGLMCRNTLSVGWDGRLFDCDFNQMLDLETSSKAPRHIRDFDYDRLSEREIALGQHCLGCTAGAGSGCQGAIVRLA